MQLHIGKSLHQAVDERALPKPPQARELAVREDQVSRAMRASDLFQPAHDIGALYPNNVGAEIHTPTG